MKRIKNLIREIKYFIQRGKRGYSDEDIWNLDSYLMEWLPKALRQLAEHHIGYPTGLSEKKWISILNKMADGFDAERVNDNLYFDGKITVDECIKGEKIANKKLQNSLKLFVKYFRNLWD